MENFHTLFAVPFMVAIDRGFPDWRSHRNLLWIDLRLLNKLV
ncbi:MAG TPA: hypothetical protein V6D25_25825 [Leptolyngbyaceae cyanobacterium]